MDDSFDLIDQTMDGPALAEGEDIDSIVANLDESVDPSQPTVDRYGFSGGDQYTDPNKEYLPPVEVLRAREMKWMSMCRNWDYWSSVGINKLRDRCRKGIPDSVRGEAWQRLVGSPTTRIEQIRVYVDESATETPQKPPNVLSFLLSNSRLSGSRSLPTVVTNSPSVSRTNLYENGPAHPNQSKSPNVSLLPQTKSTHSHDSMPRRKPSETQNFQSLRKFSSLFRLNLGAPKGEATGRPKAVADNNSSKNDDELRAAEKEEEEVDASANFYQHERRQQPSPHSPDVAEADRQRNYSAALPSAAYLGIAINGTRLAGIRGGTNGNAVAQPPDSVTTTTSTDAYSLTTSSNFFSTTESSAESLGVPGEPKDSSNSPAVLFRNPFRKECEEGDDLSPAHSSHFSTLSSGGSYCGIDPNDDCDSSPPLSLLGASANNHHHNGNTTTTADDAAAIKDRDRTLVAPGNSGSSDSRDPYVLFASYADREGDAASCDQIRKDIHRQFPFHELFCTKNSHGRESLFTILKAYTVRHAGKGYCQGQAPLAAVLLMFMPEAEAFWTFNEICERYLVAYYDEGLELIQIDGQVLYGLLKKLSPQIYKFLVKHGADPIMLVVEWFMCVYTRTLPWASALRVLDMFFCEGKIVIFKVGLLLLDRCFQDAGFRKACGGVDEILMQAQTVPASLDNPEEFVRDILKLRLNKNQVAREVMKQSQRWRCRMSALRERTNEK